MREVSSTPQACGLVFHHPRQRCAWRPTDHGRSVRAYDGDIGVIRADAHAEHFVDHRKDISQRIVPNGGASAGHTRRRVAATPGCDIMTDNREPKRESCGAESPEPGPQFTTKACLGDSGRFSVTRRERTGSNTRTLN